MSLHTRLVDMLDRHGWSDASDQLVQLKDPDDLPALMRRFADLQNPSTAVLLVLQAYGAIALPAWETLYNAHVSGEQVLEPHQLESLSLMVANGVAYTLPIAEAGSVEYEAGMRLLLQLIAHDNPIVRARAIPGLIAQTPRSPATTEPLMSLLEDERQSLKTRAGIFHVLIQDVQEHTRFSNALLDEGFQGTRTFALQSDPEWIDIIKGMAAALTDKFGVVMAPVFEEMLRQKQMAPVFQQVVGEALYAPGPKEAASLWYQFENDVGTAEHAQEIRQTIPADSLVGRLLGTLGMIEDNRLALAHAERRELVAEDCRTVQLALARTLGHAYALGPA